MDCPKRPAIEFMRIKIEAEVAISLALPALISKSIGLKKMPPPMPTTPDINPIDPPIMKDTNLGIFLFISLVSSNDLNFKSNDSPANDKTIKSKISKKFFSS